jgi:hypothetical protein
LNILRSWYPKWPWDQVTQQNAAILKQSTDVSHLLGTDAGKLFAMVSHFNVIGHIGGRPVTKSTSRNATPTLHGADGVDQPADQSRAIAANDRFHSDAV